jgi:HD-like signal output (HDOD) protein
VLQPSTPSQRELENLEAVRGLVEQHIARHRLVIPTLPTVAVKVVRIGTKNSGNAHLLADIIQTDPGLAKYVLSMRSRGWGSMM